MDNNNMKDELILTKEGKKAIEKELKNLVTVERPNVIKEIKVAREQGDLSENAEFDAAREKQGTIEDRISDIENILANSKIIQVKKNEKVVNIGSRVKLLFNNKTVEEEYFIVGTIEADPLNGKISNLSPVAIAILGKKAGDVVVVDNAIKQQKVKIISIQY
jgi:transcription elongation factor GreA